MYCTSCGAANALGSVSCGQCGTPAQTGGAQVAAVATRASGAWWVLAGLAAIFLAALAPVLFVFPWHSLMDASDGATLVGDAAIGLLVGGGALVGGILALRAILPGDGRAAPWVAAGIGAAIGLVLALSLTAEAWRLAHTTITNGYVNGEDNIFIAAAMISLLALVGLGIAMIPPGDRRERFVVAAGALGVVAGAALVAACAWTLMNATTLQQAAAARVRNETPNAALALMVVSFVVAALLRRR